jgi:hypothetical protein
MASPLMTFSHPSRPWRAVHTLSGLIAIALGACQESSSGTPAGPTNDGSADVAPAPDGASADALSSADSAADLAAADAACVATGSPGQLAAGDSVVLYTNDFEHPNQPLAITCGNSLDPSGINVLYGTPTFMFAQTNTVEGVVIHDPAGMYRNPSGQGGAYALGMLSTLQDDHLALTFPATGKPFLNVGLDLSSIDVAGCGGPFGTTAPVMQVSLYDTATATFDFAAPGTLLDHGTITGVMAPDQWTFAWQYGTVGLDASHATAGHLSVVFDLLQSGYAAFDNLSIVAASASGIVDRNNDGIPDDQQCLPLPDAGVTPASDAGITDAEGAADAAADAGADAAAALTR